MMIRRLLEQSIIGAVLVNNEAMRHLEKLEPAHFDDALHRSVFEHMRADIRAGSLVTPVTLWTHHDFGAHPDELTVKQQLVRMAAEATTIQSVGVYADMLIAANPPAQGPVEEWCGGCRFFKRRRQDNRVGRCHKRAPRPFTANHTQPAIWPEVIDTEFCGEFEQERR